MRRHRTNPARALITTLASLALLSAAAGCGTDGAGEATGGSAASDASSGGWGGGGAESDAGSAGGKPDLPPEQEKEVDFGAPEGSPNFVFVPVKGADDVVKVSGKTLKVTLIEVGDRPTVLKVVPGQDKVVVINSGSDDVAVVTSTEDDDDVRFEAVLPHCNRVALSPDGTWAAVFYDHTRANKGDPVGSFQAVTLVRVGAGQSGSLTVSVGFRPSDVRFTDDGKQAMVVTDDGVSVVDLSSAKDGDVVPAVAVADNPLAKPKEREVQITPDGTWAVVRQSDVTGLVAVHLASQKRVMIPMSSTPTDLDLSPDGSVAVAVLRNSGEVALVDLPAQTTTTLSAQVVSVKPLIAGLARISSDGATAVLYTSVGGVEQVATLDLATRKVKAVPLRKTVDYVFLAPGSRTAVLVHKPADGPLHNDDPTEAFVDDSQGYTLFDLDTGFTKLVLTPVAPEEIVVSAPKPGEVPDKAWLLLPDPKGVDHAVQEARLTTLLTYDHALGSEPEHARWLQSAGAMAVTQTHPSGRITFITTDTGAAKTVTGYELNGLVK